MSGRPEDELLPLLKIAADKFAARKGPIWSDYSSGEELAQVVRNCMDCIRAGTLDQKQKKQICLIFAPTCDWDDVVGDVELGNEIFTILQGLYGADVYKRDRA
jgi:hypothetical protein